MTASPAAALRSREINATCAPLFIGSYFLVDGHGADTVSATATFVRHQGKTYVVTCRHVSEQAYAQQGWSARLAEGSVHVNLAHWSSTGLKPSLSDTADSLTDISICPFPDETLALLSHTKPKTPIDLDSFSAPDWKNVEMCLAAGFPDRAKTEGGGRVSSPMVEIVAPLASNPAASGLIVMHEQFGAPQPYGFSGMSGGPIFALDGQGRQTPVGILFEGHPSHVGTVAQGGIFGPNDVMIRGHVLTPEIFQSWLSDARTR